jgi:hypothetical protein
MNKNEQNHFNGSIDHIPGGTFHGGDSIPAGTFHGGDSIPAGTFLVLRSSGLANRVQKMVCSEPSLE